MTDIKTTKAKTGGRTGKTKPRPNGEFAAVTLPKYYTIAYLVDEPNKRNPSYLEPRVKYLTKPSLVSSIGSWCEDIRDAVRFQYKVDASAAIRTYHRRFKLTLTLIPVNWQTFCALDNLPPFEGLSDVTGVLNEV